MSAILRVYISEHWPERPATRWALLDAQEQLLQQGESDALHWPPAESCEAILAGVQTSMLRVALPARIAKRNLDQVIAGAIEDRVLEELDRLHLTLVSRQADTADVLVVSRARLRNIIAQFSALQRPLAAAYSELETIPGKGSENRLVIEADSLLVAGAGKPPCVLDRPASAGEEQFGDALRQMGNFQHGAEVLVFPAAGESVVLERWQSVFADQRLRTGGEYRWYARSTGANDLLHGEFSSRYKRSDIWRAVRPAVWVAGGALMVYLVVLLAQAGGHYLNASSATTRKLELFHSAFPSMPVVAPLAQTRQQLDMQRAAHGLPRSDDALAMMAVVADSLGGSAEHLVEEASFVDHRLTVALSTDSEGLFGKLEQDLALRGYRATRKVTATGRTSIVIEVNKTK